MYVCMYVCISVGDSQILTVNLGESSTVDITIPCGGRDPPYTYIHSGSPTVADEFYTAVNQDQSNNGEIYCCTATGGTTCYQLNITCVLLGIANVWVVITLFHKYDCMS